MVSSASRPPSAHGRLARAFVAVAASISLLVAAGTAYGIVAYRQAGHAKPDLVISRGDGGGGQDKVTGPCIDGVCNYLLLGSDSRSGLSKSEQTQFGTNKDIGGSNRADTIMLVHTDPKLKKAIILSFPRDLWVDIPGHGPDKINAAFEGGVDGNGPAMMAATIHKLTGLKINHVLYVDLAGFQGVVDTLGGVQMCIQAENVNTPDGFIDDPLTALHVKPGCQTLDGVQALAYVRTRHLRCDSAAPDFYRIGRQQQFLRAVINRLLQPQEILKLPGQIRPIMANLRKDRDLNIADLVYLVGQLRGVSTGAAEFRSVPAYPYITPDGLDALKMDPSAEQIFEAIAAGRPIGNVGMTPVYTPPSPANVTVPVVDHASGGKAQGVEQVLSDSGFDIAPGIVAYAGYGAGVAGDVIAYAPGHAVEAEVVQQYLPGLQLKQVKGLPDHVAVYVTSAYTPAQVGSGGASTPPDCLGPNG
jgi:LCP family protein required for cell wall assembly